MAEDKDGSPDFKVVDRRSFSADGSKRPEAPLAEQEAEAPTTSARSTARQVRPEAKDYSEAESSGFDTLVSYLSTTAMFQLGLIPGPSGERVPVDFPNARRTIDLLEVLRQKTQGNLTGDESQLLEEVLYHLRMSFVELQKRQARKGK